MIQSMTAFARAALEEEWGQLSIEIRCLNSRYLEINPRLHDDMRFFEPQIREQIPKKLKRGKVDVFVRMKRKAGTGTELVLNKERMQAIAELQKELKSAFPESEAASLGEIIRMPGLIEESEADSGPLADAARKALQMALVELVENRQREGAALKDIIEKRLEEMTHIAGQMRELMPEIRKALKEKLENRLAEIDVELDTGRLEQELALQIQRIDVDEELDRLDTHIKEMHRVLKKGGVAGRRLDFLCQELNREANTLGSKSVDQRSSTASVDLKMLIEQIREQVQNIE